MATPAILAAIKDIHELLKRYDRREQALTMRLIDLYHDDAMGFEQFLTSDQLWAKPGSIWQVSFYESELHSAADAKDDDVAFHRAIVRLVAAMGDAGFTHPRAESVAKTFGTWLKLNTKSAGA